MSEQVPGEPEPEETDIPENVGRAALSGADVAEHAGSAEFEGVDGFDDGYFNLASNPSDFRRGHRR